MKGEIIKERLSQIGKSQTELAKLLDVHPTTISEILSSADVKTGTLERISKALNVPISFFFEDVVAKNIINNVNDFIENSYKGKMRETSQLGEKVQDLLSSQGKDFKSLCEFTQKTEAGLKKMFLRDNCNIDVLSKLSKFFDVPVTYFLPEDRQFSAIDSKKDEEIHFLRGKVEAYEKTLAALGAIESPTILSTPPPLRYETSLKT